MTDDDREPFEPGDVDSQADEAGDPAQAFEALRQAVETQGAHTAAEMTVIRRGVEAAFEQFEKFQQPADYSADLGQIVQQLGIVAQHLEAVEKSPILKNGPEHYARALERSGESLVRTAAQQFENESRDFQRVAREMAGQVKSARERRVQNRFLWIVGTAGVVAGIGLTLLLPARLPGRVKIEVAAFVMGNSRWSAGLDMMRAHNETRLNDFLFADDLVQANRDAVAACYQRAQSHGADQECKIIVEAPRQ